MKAVYTVLAKTRLGYSPLMFEIGYILHRFTIVGSPLKT